MQSLRDKNRTKNLRTKITLSLGALALILVIIGGVFPKAGSGFRTLFTPLVSAEMNIAENLRLFFANLASKRALLHENEILKQTVIEQQTRLIDHDVLLRENESLKELVGRDSTRDFILGTILVKPSRSLYDTLILDIGKEAGVREGALVYAFGTVPLGTITTVDATTSIVTLFSTAGQKIHTRIESSKIDIELTGRGGGNFELKAPRDIVLEPGTNVLLPGLHPAIVAVVAKNITDARDPSQTFLLTSPVNVNELAWVEVLK